MGTYSIQQASPLRSKRSFGVGTGNGVGELDGLGATVGSIVGSAVGVGVGSSVGVGSAVGEAVGSTVGSGLGVGVGSPRGSKEELLFCGLVPWAVVLYTKSASLLSLSSPFPRNSSSPPSAIEILVEETSALRSMLRLLAGEVVVAVSTSVASPIPILSINASVLSQSNTVLLVEIVFGPE